MTPNLRLEQHCRTLTAFGQRMLDQRYRFQQTYPCRLLENEEDEQSQTRREHELERVV